MKLTARQIFDLPRDQALDYIRSLNPADLDERIFKLHVTEVIHNAIGSETDDIQHFKLALQSAWEGIELAVRNSHYPPVLGKMARNFIADAGHLQIDIRDKLPLLRLVALAAGDPAQTEHSWWNSNFYYFTNPRILDTAKACLSQYRRCERFDAVEAVHMEACLNAFSGKGISELTRLRSQAAQDLIELVDNNLRFITGPGFKPAAPKDWRDYKPRGQEWFDFALDRHMDALALILDVLEDCGDPRLALAVESLRQCNQVLDQAAMQEISDSSDESDFETGDEPLA